MKVHHGTINLWLRWLFLRSVRNTDKQGRTVSIELFVCSPYAFFDNLKHWKFRLLTITFPVGNDRGVA